MIRKLKSISLTMWSMLGVIVQAKGIMLRILGAAEKVRSMVDVNSRETITPDDEDVRLAKEICESYRIMVEDSQTLEKPYKIGEFWDYVINTHKSDFYSPIRNGDIGASSIVLANFLRTSATEGLWDGASYSSMMKNSRNKLSLINQTMDSYDFWKVLNNDTLDLGILALPSVGNPFGCKIDGVMVSIVQFKQYYYAQQVMSLVKNVGQESVVAEIGGGFGGVAHYLSRMGFDGTYINFDIPETLILSHYFLKKAYPGKNILTYNGQARLTLDDIKNYDIILMPNYMLPMIPDLCVDIVFNTRSFSEMSTETIGEYMLQINRICKRYLYHDNSNLKSHPHEVPSHVFPIPESFRLIFKTKGVWYKTVHNRFVEHLYERHREDE